MRVQADVLGGEQVSLIRWFLSLFQRKPKRTEVDLAMIEIGQSQRSPLSVLLDRFGVAQENKCCRGGSR